MDKRVFLLKRKQQYEQRSQEWFDVRRTLVTASSAASLLIRNKKTCESYVKEYKLEHIFDYNNKSCNPYSSRTQYILDKCRQGAFKGNIATYWGQKYESVVTDLYSNLTNKEVLEFGLMVHDEHKWLGASPDGITMDGVMIEIKCPFRRKITGIPPFYYWIQVQLQLEVCNLDYCDFVEYEFTEFKNEEEFMDDITLTTNIKNKGIFIQVDPMNQDSTQEGTNIPYDMSKSQYIYPEKHFLDNSDDLLKWRDIQLKTLPETIDEKYKNDKFIYTPIYWKVTDSSIVRIERDREWFSNIKPVLENQWKKLLYYKKADNYKKLLLKDKVFTEGHVLVIKDEKECVFSDDENTN